MQRPSIIPDGSTQGGTIQLTGPFGGPRTAVYVSEGARVLDIYVVHPGRLTADIWARIWPWGGSEDLQGPQKGASGAETGTFGVSRNVVDAPEVLGRPWEPKRLWLVHLGEPNKYKVLWPLQRPIRPSWGPRKDQ